jgi:hypothetical protein
MPYQLFALSMGWTCAVQLLAVVMPQMNLPDSDPMMIAAYGLWAAAYWALRPKDA